MPDLHDSLDRGGNKYAFVDRARNLVWALVAQGLLNSEKLQKYTETWGQDLLIDADYSEELKKIASTRVRSILAELLKEKSIATQIEEERYGFLRTKAVFNMSMDIAYDKWRWTKRNF